MTYPAYVLPQNVNFDNKPIYCATLIAGTPTSDALVVIYDNIDGTARTDLAGLVTFNGGTLPLTSIAVANNFILPNGRSWYETYVGIIFRVPPKVFYGGPGNKVDDVYFDGLDWRYVFNDAIVGTGNVPTANVEVTNFPTTQDVRVTFPLPTGTNTIGNIVDYGAVTTTSPTYISGTNNAMSLNTSGGLRVDGSGVIQPVSGSVTTTSNDSQLDAFGRLKVSNSYTLYDTQQEYGLDTSTSWDAVANGVFASPSSNGSVTNAGTSVGPRDINTRLVPITISSTNGHYAVLQSKPYIRYIPGMGHSVYITGIFSPNIETNTEARSGYFDGANGVFLQAIAGVMSLVQRTSTSGSVSDANAETQSNWNIDPLNGSGPSGVTLDFTKTQILHIAAQWLGVGDVTVGFHFNGVFLPAHRFSNSNSLVVPYTQTFNLPVRMELRNTVASAGGTIYFNCTSVQSENGRPQPGINWAAGTGIVDVDVTTRRPILSIRPKATFNGITNRAHIENLVFKLRTVTNDNYYELVLGGTLTGADWTSVHADSVAEIDTAATAITGGRTGHSGYSISSQGQFSEAVSNVVDIRNPMCISQLDALLNNQQTLSLVATSMNNTSTVSALVNWREQVI